MALPEPSETERNAQGVYDAELTPPTTATAKGRWAGFWKAIRSFLSRPEVASRTKQLSQAAVDAGVEKLREQAVKNAEFEANTRKMLAEARKADAEARKAEAEAGLAEAQAEKVLADAASVREDTAGAFSKRIREEYEFLRRNGIQVCPAARDGELAGIYVQALPIGAEGHVSGAEETAGRVTIADQPAATVHLSDMSAPAVMGQGTTTVDGVPIPIFLEANDQDDQ